MTVLAMIWLSLAVVAGVTVVRGLAAIHAALVERQESCGVVWREIAEAATRGIQYVVLLGVLLAAVHLDRAAATLVYPVAALVGLREVSVLATLVLPPGDAPMLTKALGGLWTDQGQGGAP